ncbi:MAG: hypothetical protein WC547_04320 [Candidatus Omnitrophota bacterium]
MFNDLARKLEREGRLVRQKAGFVQIEVLLREALVDLQEAGKTQPVSSRATYMLAYMAMLKAGRALLLLEGYRPDDGAQHKTVIETTHALLGRQYAAIVNHFEIMRRKRNEMTYEAGVMLSKAETDKAFADAVSLVKHILEMVKKNNPQMELKFK